MPIIAAMLAAQAEPYAPPCTARHLRLSVQPRTGVADFAPRSGFLLSIRNLGPDCSVPALPIVTLRDARGRALPAFRRPPLGMHPGPVMVPVFIGGGHRATIEFGWTPGRRATVRARSVAVSFGRYSLTTPAGTAVPPVPVGQFGFDQAPVHAEEGMAAG